MSWNSPPIPPQRLAWATITVTPALHPPTPSLNFFHCFSRSGSAVLLSNSPPPPSSLAASYQRSPNRQQWKATLDLNENWPARLAPPPETDHQSREKRPRTTCLQNRTSPVLTLTLSAPRQGRSHPTHTHTSTSATSLKPRIMKPKCRMVASRNLGTRQKQTCRGSFCFKARRWAYRKAQLSGKEAKGKASEELPAAGSQRQNEPGRWSCP